MNDDWELLHCPSSSLSLLWILLMFPKDFTTLEERKVTPWETNCRPKSWICPLHAISTRHFMVNMFFCELFSCIWLCFQAASQMACLQLCASYSGIRISTLTCCFTVEIYRWTDKSLLWFVCVLCVCLCSTRRCEERPECLTRCHILCKVLMWVAQRVRGILAPDLTLTYVIQARSIKTEIKSQNPARLKLNKRYMEYTVQYIARKYSKKYLRNHPHQKEVYLRYTKRIHHNL